MKFNAPELEVVRFGTEDIVTTSGFVPGKTNTIFGTTYQWAEQHNDRPILFACITDGLVEGKDFICVNAYNA